MKTFKIVLLTLLGLFVMGAFGFVLLCNIFFKKAMDYNNSIPVLTGTFETPDSVRAPLSGQMTNVAVIHVNSTRWNLGDDMKDKLDDFFDVLEYKPGTKLNVNGKKYALAGQRPRWIKGKKRSLAGMTTTCGYKNQEPVPHSLDGIDAKLDYYIGQLRKGDCGFGTGYHRFNLAEYCYSLSDTVTLKAIVRNDTIFLDTSKY
jgi:hypothetical protein